MRFHPIPAALLAVLLCACSTVPDRTASTTGSTRPAPAITTVAERFVSVESPGDQLDSLATWTGEDGRSWVIASAKGSHRLVVFDGDSGERLREVGSRGNGDGQFNRPNGVAVHGDRLFVVERDNRRVQVLSLPGFESLGHFGTPELRSPYGLWVGETEPGELQVYVTDSYMHGARADQLPPLAELDQRVRQYRVRFDAHGRPQAHAGAAFGDTSEAAALRLVESIAGDTENARLLIADEGLHHDGGMPASSPRESTLREYTLAGRYTGRSLPQDSFDAEAEGIALWTCPDGGGYWLAADQRLPQTVFHLFDRLTLAPRGSFRGITTAHTDGIALHAAATPSFPGGVLFAVHDDKAVSAFDLRDIARALELAPGCVE